MGAALKRLLLLLVGLVPLCACSPDVDRLVAWLHQQQDQAVAEGKPCAEYAGDIAWRGLPDHFLDVIWRESNCHPEAVNAGSGALGLAQIMPFWLNVLCPMGVACTPADLLTASANLDATAHVYAAQGPAAWSQTW